jgi:hypothetical protein
MYGLCILAAIIIVAVLVEIIGHLLSLPIIYMA